MKKISLFLTILFFKAMVFSQITANPSSWTTAYCNQEFGLKYEAGAVTLNQRVSPTVGTGSTQSAVIPISGIESSVQIRKAILWFSIVGQTAPVTSYPGLTLKNPSGTTLAVSNITCVSSINNSATGWQGSDGTNFASGYTNNYRAEVTLVGSVYNGNYLIGGFPTILSTNPDIDITGATLMIIYKDNNSCMKGSLFIQDTYINPNQDITVNFSSLPLCFTLPPLNSSVNQFMNIVDCEDITDPSINIDWYNTPTNPNSFQKFTGDLWNLVTTNSYSFNYNGSLPSSTWFSFSADSPDQSFASVKGIYWQDNSLSTPISPSFTVPYYICQGSVVTMNGTASTGAIEQHMWTIIETNSGGTPLSGATEWIGNWIPGTPTANETFPTPANGGPTLTCGKYYKIKLALNNDCQVWVETTRNIAIACNPVLDFRNSTSSICSSKGVPGTGYLSLYGLTGSYNVKWYKNNPDQTQSLIYNGGLADIIVHPVTTTTYTCVLTNLTTGCTAVGNYTITVYPHMNASFSHSVTPVNSTYYTLSATPSVTTSASTPGFTQTWKVEEFLTNGTILSTIYNSNWQVLPLTTATNFCGFDDVTYNYSGTVNLTSTVPSLGKFLYGHYYRITRTVSANNCPPDNFVLELNQVYMPQAPAIEARSMNVSDFEATIGIYPNPSNGIFNIVIPNAENCKVQIFDVLGSEIKSFSTQSDVDTYEIDLSTYAKGIYTVQFISEGNIIKKKIVKE